MAGQAKVQISPVDLQVTPGGSPVSVRVDIFNAGKIVDQFWAGPFQAQEWLNGPPSMINMYPGEQGSVELSLSIPAGRVVQAGAYPLTIRVVSTATRQVVHDQQIQLRVTPVVGGAVLKLQPSETWGTDAAVLSAEVSHSGNAPVEVEFSGETGQGVLTFGFAPPKLVVPPAGVAGTVVTVGARAPFFGDDVPHQFTIHALGFAQPLHASGVFHQSPVFGRKRMRLLSLGLTILGGLIVLLAGLIPALHWTTGSASAYGGLDWSWYHYADQVLPYYLLPAPKIASFLNSQMVSAGTVVAVLAVLAIVGALVGKKRLARIPAALIVVVMIAFLISLVFADDSAVAAGSVLVLVGGILAFAGSLFVRPLKHGMKLPKVGKLPKVPPVVPPNVRRLT